MRWKKIGTKNSTLKERKQRVQRQWTKMQTELENERVVEESEIRGRKYLVNGHESESGTM